ncbi:hypothetical protein [Synechococcus sp. UW86]|uniref:hypothetical protein n=1 Tax=Synechococcus sp. UW86 TaxID=368491 RepID=UPI001FCB70C0|nr:hypothetical protein [Synechococcus sp. UW86]
MKLSAALLAIALSAPMGLISPAAAEQLTRTELTPAQATAAAELLLEALKNRQETSCMTLSQPRFRPALI